MKGASQAWLGLLSALLSITILVGGLWISFVETGTLIARAPAPTASPSATPGAIASTSSSGRVTSTAILPPTLTATYTMPPPTSCPPPAGWVALRLTTDENLENLAQNYLTTAAALAQANCLVTNNLRADMEIYVPPIPPTATPLPTDTPTPTPTMTSEPTEEPCEPSSKWVKYTVKSGDTISSLSRAVGINAAQLRKGNCLGKNASLKAGQVIVLPHLPPSPTSPGASGPATWPPNRPRATIVPVNPGG